jgi:enediyne biosynthesis protein E5
MTHARDARHFQVAVLAALLSWGLVGLDFEVTQARVALLVGTALLSQLVCTRWAGLPGFDPWSALISALSLCLLVRADAWWLAALAAVLAIASKFTLRIAGRHVFNPTNFALAALLLATDRVWVSPGQWGNVAFFAAAIACAGSLVVFRAARADVTLAFLAVYGGLLFGRAALLGDPVEIPLHQLQAGGLLIFSFFMISDPKTTPDDPIARVLFAGVVAVVAWYIRFRLFRPNDLIWSLFFCTPLVPVLNYFTPRVRARLRALGLGLPSRALRGGT